MLSHSPSRQIGTIGGRRMVLGVVGRRRQGWYDGTRIVAHHAFCGIIGGRGTIGGPLDHGHGKTRTTKKKRIGKQQGKSAAYTKREDKSELAYSNNHLNIMIGISGLAMNWVQFEIVPIGKG